MRSNRPAPLVQSECTCDPLICVSFETDVWVEDLGSPLSTPQTLIPHISFYMGKFQFGGLQFISIKSSFI